ncbi:unnamed protein product [Paramecium octaurelia]|uniref:WD40-repeat-containing domain n=1 Tax=Paramecium octaurelia TaxID=43137 RepID=A0A8S1VNL0_PAROT|nr:unnamed protein product [Paramecium octaurelia]
MFQPKMIENVDDFFCSSGHRQPVFMVALDPKLEWDQRFLCTTCAENSGLDAQQVGFKKIIQIIQESQEKKMEKVESIVVNEIKLVESMYDLVDQMKTIVIKQFEESISIMKEWTKNLQQKGQEQSHYSFYEELEDIIKKNNKSEANVQSLIHEVQQTNHCWSSKLCPKLEYFNKFEEYKKCKELLSKLQLDSMKFTQNEYQQQINLDSPLKNNYSDQDIQSEGEIKLKLLDQSVKQLKRCNDIVFNSNGSIMVSTSENDIKIWRFQNGTIKQGKTLERHTDCIQCLVYSKKSNSFISSDKTIRCWKLIDQNDWCFSQSYQQHTDYVMCMILNSNEDLLFSGSRDKSIKVWKVDFIQNKLTYQYSLDKHDHYVISLSLNQSETQLVSCAKKQNQIIIWERREKDKFEFKYFVKQSIQLYGQKVKFIKNDQFIWITGDEQMDNLYVFELQQETFQENQEKTIQLIKNKENIDQYRFPIIYNKERNLIVVRHKKYIYIIREISDGRYKIVDQLKCDTSQVYGTVTNNGKYLVYWDEKNSGYSTYQL